MFVLKSIKTVYKNQMKFFKIILLSILINLSIFLSISLSDVIDKILITGNKRISDKTILMFIDINVGDNIDISDTNTALKNLYETNFFDNVSVDFTNNIFKINVDEAPLIENINISGVKAKKYKELIQKSYTLKPRSSYNKFTLIQDVKSIETSFKSIGFYFIKVEPLIELLDNNLINLEYKVDLGEKAKIAKISFIGDKIYKNRKLKSVIISEEYKFWKFISGKKYLQ